MNLLNANYQLLENTFLYKLSVDRIFDIKSLNNLIDEIVLCLKSKYVDNKCQEDFDRKNNVKIFFIYDRLNRLLIAHFNENDSFKLNMFEYSGYYDYLDRFRFVTKCFFSNDYQSIIAYEDDLGTLI